MSTLHDLRSTLEQHAGELDDTEQYARTGAVRTRIRAVRRRRAGIAAVAAALVLLAGVATVDSLRTPDTVQPADRVVAGVDVPGRIDLLEFPYDLTDVTDLTQEDTHVDPAKRGQAVVLAASGLGTGSATLYSQGDPIARVLGDQQVSAPVDLGDAGVDLEVRLDGAAAGARAGVAVYEATGELAPGVDDGHAVFRREVAGDSLLAAGFASPGESSIELDVHSTGRALRFVFYCTADESELWLQASVDGAGGMGSSCPDHGPDAGVGSSATSRIPAGDHRVRVYLTDGPRGDEVAPPDGAVIGLGVYEVDGSGQEVLGQTVAPRVEYAGRTWQLWEVTGAPMNVGAPDDLLLGLVGRGDEVRATWSGRLTRGETARVSSPDEATLTLGSMLLTGDSYDVSVVGGVGKVLVYRPL